MANAWTKVDCPECGDDRPHKDGCRSQRQLYKCRMCLRQFGGGQYPSGDRFPDAVIADALRQYYEGRTYREVASNVTEQHGITDTEIAASTVMRWVSKFTGVAVRAVEGLKAIVGDALIIDVSVIDVFGSSCWQLLDRKSRYLLAMRCFWKSEPISLRQLINDADNSGKSLPNVMYCRCWPQTGELGEPIARLIKADLPEIEVRITDEVADLNPVLYSPEGAIRYNANVLLKVGSRFKCAKSANTYLQGWKISYNFMGGKKDGSPPPALQVVADPPFVSWTDVIALARSTRKRRRTGSQS